MSTSEYEVRCPDCNALVAVETGIKAARARRDGVTFPCEPCSIRRLLTTVPTRFRVSCGACESWCNGTEDEIAAWKERHVAGNCQRNRDAWPR